MTKNEKQIIETRSEKARNIIDNVPSNLIISGYIITISIVIVLLVAIIFIPFPYEENKTILQHIITSLVAKF